MNDVVKILDIEELRDLQQIQTYEWMDQKCGWHKKWQSPLTQAYEAGKV